jgi:hypothetical protein
VSLKVFVKLVLVTSFILLPGCVPSLNPLYFDQDVIFDPALLGVWAETDSKETWTFTKRVEKEYQLINIDKEGKKSELVAHLLRIRGEMFLDLLAVKPADLQDNDLLLPLHTFVLVLQIGPPARISWLDPDWLKEFLAKNPAAIRHATVHNETLITAPTPELQKFLLSNLKAKGAFSQPTELKRKEDGQ